MIDPNFALVIFSSDRFNLDLSILSSLMVVRFDPAAPINFNAYTLLSCSPSFYSLRPIHFGLDSISIFAPFSILDFDFEVLIFE
ncbi:hypothetical protein DFH28DRAFT_1127582 [Melampsora americana]|nr:hypothetical protein DFH28DRAFT_1127582 [Melampsora americana]